MIKALTNLILVFLFSGLSFAQNVSVLKDSVCISHECLELQEIKIDTKNTDIYKQLQKSYDIFNGALFVSPEKRLQAKKDTLKDLISKNSLRESQFGFEKYDILYNRKGLLNVSVGIQSYGSPWEDTKYYLFDTTKNIEIGERLFTDKKTLLMLCRKKLKAQENKSFTIRNLSQYIINKNDTGKVTGIGFVFLDEKNRTNSGYPQYIVLFEWKEIEKFMVPEYKKLLIEK